MNPREDMWSLINTLFPICRSITGDGVRQTVAWHSIRRPEGFLKMGGG